MSKVRGSSWMRLVSAVLIGLMATGTLGVGAAAAQDLPNRSYVFYPWVQKDTSILTLVTYINPNVDPPSGHQETLLHYQYQFKAAADPLGGNCSPYSVTGDSSQNDMLTFIATGDAPQQPLFNDTSSSGGANGLSLLAPSPFIAYLTINDEVAEGTSDHPGNGQGFGEALIVDLANSGMWGYNAIAIPEGSDGGGIGTAAALVTGTRRPVAFLPPTLAVTTFAVTSLPNNLRTPGNVDSGPANNRTSLNLQLSTGVPGIYDRNEFPLDGGRIVRMRCVARLTMADLLSAPLLASPTWTTQGGWAWLSNTDRAASDPIEDLQGIRYDRNAIVFKIQTAGTLVDAQLVPSGLCGTEASVFNVVPGSVVNAQNTSADCRFVDSTESPLVP